MRLLLVSDLHYTLKQYDWVVGEAASFDVVVVAGDHLDISGMLPVQAQAVAIVKHLERLSQRTQTLVSSGNHDLTARDAAGEMAPVWISKVREAGIPVDGDYVEVVGYGFSICPWWEGPVSKQAIADQLARDAERVSRDRWVWVYHAPPTDSPTSFDGRRSWGDQELRAWIDQYHPAIVLCGHIHQSPFRKGGSWADRVDDTWVFNAGRQIGPVPTHIIVDTEAGRAEWYSLAGPEMVDLTNPAIERVALDLGAAQ